MLRRALVLTALIIAVMLFAPSRPAAAVPDVGLRPAGYTADAAPEITAQPATARSCADLVSDRAQLDRERPDLDPRGARGSPYPLLCLMYYPAEDVYQAVLLGLDGSDHFRAVKADAAQRLADDGFDLCNIGTWDAYGQFTGSNRLRADDLKDLPVECPPRVRGADAGANARLREIGESVTRIVDLTGDQMSWRPNRALTVIAMTDVNVAVATTLRYARGLPPDEIAKRAREGRSVTINGSVYGTLILLNMVDARNFAVELSASVAHEYTHFAQAGIGAAADLFPYWFIEGQGDFQEERNSPVRFRHRDVAARTQREGTAPRLSALSDGEGWFGNEASLGSDVVYSRGYVAVVFLVERFGFGATVQLLRDNRNGSIDNFNALLAALTGSDLDAFDDALGDWILAGMPPLGGQPPPTTTAAPPATPRPGGTPPPPPPPPPPVAAGVAPSNARFTAVDSQGFIFIDFTTNSDGSRARGSIRFDRDFLCPRTFIPAGTATTFDLSIRADGVFSGTNVSGSAVLTLDGRFVNPGEVTGALRYNNSIGTGCDTGLLAFVARRAG
jgi:hypothetical protein